MPLWDLQVANKEFVCRSCLSRTLKKLENMMVILQGETLQGTMTPTSIADNILNIMGQFSRGSFGGQEAPCRGRHLLGGLEALLSSASRVSVHYSYFSKPSRLLIAAVFFFPCSWLLM